MRSISAFPVIAVGAVLFTVAFWAAMRPDASPVCVAAEPASGWKTAATAELNGLRVSLSKPVLVARSKGYLYEEEKMFKMWYLPEPAGEGGYFDDPNVTCYAVSRNGVAWEKPLVGTLKAKNGKPHNAVAHIHQASVFKDLREPDAAKRYKCVGWSSQPPGYDSFVSPNGLKWTKFGLNCRCSWSFLRQAWPQRPNRMSHAPAALGCVLAGRTRLVYHGFASGATSSNCGKVAGRRL